MASNLRRADDLERIKLRHLVFQNDDGTYPAPYSVAVMDPTGTTSEVTWSDSITIDSVTANHIVSNEEITVSNKAIPGNTTTMRFTTDTTSCFIQGGSGTTSGNKAPIYFTAYNVGGSNPTLTVDIPNNKVGVNQAYGVMPTATLDVNGSINGSSLNVSGGITAGGNLSVTGPITGGGTMEIQGVTKFYGDVYFYGEVNDDDALQPLTADNFKAQNTASDTIIAGTTTTYADSGYALDIRGNTKTTGNIQLPTGVAQGTPSLTFIGDTNTGIFQSVAGDVSIASDGASKITVSGGGVNIDAGNLSFSGSSGISLNTGGITMASGGLSMTNGDITLGSGSINLTNGSLTVGGTFSSRVITATAATTFNISGYYGQYVFVTGSGTINLNAVGGNGTVVVLINTTTNNIGFSGLSLLGVSFPMPPNSARTLLSNGSNWYGL
jgi:hypothetical protein